MIKATKYLTIKALLIIGSAVMFISCSDQAKSGASKKSVNSERLMTESSDNLTMVMTENGRPSYIFKSKRVEGFTLAAEPYREFPKGVEITTFKDDSLTSKDATLTSNYAIYYEKRKLWEAMGDVVVKKTDGKELYSQQLFWNAQSKLIYSNVDTKILDTTTGDVYLGEGFESDEDMKKWSFRKMKGRMKMEVQPRRPAADSTAVSTLAADSTAVTAVTADPTAVPTAITKETQPK
ncbi:MAG: LPS export ABC transporter periplasmic protein LptC [Rikenellaceae bacterium]